ncbi:Alpha-1-inhibitor 3-like, partial [Homarus americanus]
VLVWYTREDGEVVADTRELEVEKCLGSSASLTWSESQAQPGQQTTLTLSSEPNSVCSLGVVDRSSELLAKDVDPISLEKLFDFVDNFDINRWINSQIYTPDYCEKKKLREKEKDRASLSDLNPIIFPEDRPSVSYYSNYDSGLYVLTDQTVETRPCEEDEALFFEYDGPPEALGIPQLAADFDTEDRIVGGAGGGNSSPSPSPPPPEDAPRTDFPETWIWDLVVLPSSGVNSQNLTLPDTITQWVGKAVCAHPEKGVALSERESITTFTPFFVDLTLPPTVKRGEILPVKMSIFNYLDRPIPVSVSVGESAEYEIIQEPGAPGELGRRSSCLPAQDKVVHTVKIKPLVIGEVNITVSAFVDYQYSEPCGSGDTSIEKR